VRASTTIADGAPIAGGGAAVAAGDAPASASTASAAPSAHRRSTGIYLSLIR
jgi:hypothetical protein